MKVAIIGNMNNNGFALLRYLRDKGVEADLLLLKDDGVGISSHFSIEADSWHAEKWGAYVKRLPVSGGYGLLLSQYSLWLLFCVLMYAWRTLKGDGTSAYWRPASKRSIAKFRDLLQQYDCRIGSGLMPAACNLYGVPLEIFLPYAVGVEHVEDPIFREKFNSRNPIVRTFARMIASLQVKGLSEVKIAINGEMSLTQKVLRRIGIDTHLCLFPVVYPYEESDASCYSTDLVRALNQIEKSDFVGLCHARHLWINQGFSAQTWLDITKHSDWILRAFSKFLQARPSTNSKLILFKYGADFRQSMALCEHLGIARHVAWLPVMSRKEILVLLRRVHFGVGEFYRNKVTLGGGGLEILACGQPLIQGPMEQLCFYREQPPFLEASSIDQIFDHIITLHDNPKMRQALGARSKEWFDCHIREQTVGDLISLCRRFSESRERRLVPNRKYQTAHS